MLCKEAVLKTYWENLLGPETYSELCETSKMECFRENSPRDLFVNYFRKALHLRCLGGF